MSLWWSTWVGWRSRMAEVHNLDPAVATGISHELGTSLGELRALAGKWPDSNAELLGRRFVALDIDLADISRSQPATARDLAVRCALCSDKRRCRHDLDRHPGSPEWQKYCANAVTLAALKSERDGRMNGGRP
jgi:hypothetical protein